jgi:sugar O-acyltransferase (sialic acid O-acetyltransferase NeuD family)
MTDRPVIVLGAGGHARVVLDALRSIQTPVAGVVAPSAPTQLDVPWLGDDAWLLTQHREAFSLVNALGSTRSTDARAALFVSMRDAGFAFVTVVHHRAIVAANVELGVGAMVMAGAIVQPGVRVGENVLVNTGAQLDHDCEVGAHSHIAPGVVCSGAVRIGERSHIGVGAVIVQGVSIGAGALVGAGCVVIRDVAAHSTVVGNPAREVRR